MHRIGPLFAPIGLAAFFCICEIPSISQAPVPPKTDPALVEQGRSRFAKDCASCHGADARGGSAPDLVRSVLVLHDRGGKKEGVEFPPVLKSGSHNFDYDKNQLKELSQFLTYSVNATLRSGPNTRPTNMQGGNASAGAVYFQQNCSSCHSVTGDLASYGKRFDAVNIQQRLVFPNRILGGSKKKTQVTVVKGNAAPISGTLVRIDDFDVTLAPVAGGVVTISRSPKVKVTLDDPLKGHYELLNRYTDDDIHNLTAYLETLK